MKHLILIFCLLLTSGCAYITTNSDSPPILKEAIPYKGLIENFKFTGKFVIFIDDKGFSGSLTWDSNDKRDYVKIYNPFSSLIASITLKYPEKKIDLQVMDKNNQANTDQTLKKIFLAEENIFTLKKFLVNPPTNISKDGEIDVNFDGWDIRYIGLHPQGQTAQTTIFKKNNISIKIFINKWGI